MRLSFSFSQKGFSLTETLITGGILGGMALVGSQLFKNQSKGQKQVESSYEIVNILQSQRQTLSSVNNCTQSFLGKNPQGGTATDLKRYRTLPTPGFEAIYPVNQEIHNHIKVLNYTLSKNDIPAATLETFLKVTFSRGKSAISETSTKLLRLGYTADGSGNILTCWVLNSDVNTFWLQSSIDPNDIFYSGGEVGVGPTMTDPQHTLDIAGDLRIKNGPDSLIASGLTLTGSGTVVLSPSMSSPGNITANGDVSGATLNSTGAVTAASGVFTGSLQSGTVVASSGIQSPSFEYSSDRTLKENIRPIRSPLARVSLLRGVEFEWKATGKKEIGFIAQEIEKSEPTLSGSGANKMKTVKYGNVTALLVEAVKELRKEVAELRRQNIILQTKISKKENL